MRPVTTQTLVDGLAFGEGPRWHDGSLYLSDMHSHRVLQVDMTGRVETVLVHDRPVSGLGWLPDGRLLVVDMAGFVLRVDDDAVVEHADLRALAAHGINDMISHPGGWSYVGQFGYDRHAGQSVVPSPLLRVDADGTVSAAADDMRVANGMAITPDGSTLLVAESAGGRITSFPIGDKGDLGPRSTFAELDTAPDGMCIDAEGAAWVGCVVGGRFARVLPGGEETDSVPMPEGRNAVACVLGGPDRRTLFMLTASTFGEDDRSRAAMDARVETIEVAVPGAGRP